MSYSQWIRNRQLADVMAETNTLSIPLSDKKEAVDLTCQAQEEGDKIPYPDPSLDLSLTQDRGTIIVGNALSKPCALCQHLHAEGARCVRPSTIPRTPEPGVGTRLGPYYLQALVGEGGMGRVFRAVHEKLGRQVAIKLMRRSVSLGDGVERFLREARVVNKARHKNLIEITDIVESAPGDDSYYVMEWLEGKNLHGRMLECNGLIPTPEFLRIMLDVARGLQAAHEAGLVHRDLKPENIYLADRMHGPIKEHVVKVIDFGVAYDKSEKKGALDDYIVGTPAYIAPEQAKGLRADPRSDIYSFGVILYELATGKLPFAETPDTETVALRQSTPVPRPRKVAPSGAEIPSSLETLILRCMSEDLSGRPRDMLEVQAELEAILKEMASPSVARTLRPVLRVLPPVLIVSASLSALYVKREPIRSGVTTLTTGLLATPQSESPLDAAEGPLPLQVEVRSSPSGAEVRYGGVTLGTTPCVIRLPEGQREVELYKSGYRKERRLVDVRVGQKLQVKLSR